MNAAYQLLLLEAVSAEAASLVRGAAALVGVSVDDFTDIPALLQTLLYEGALDVANVAFVEDELARALAPTPSEVAAELGRRVGRRVREATAHALDEAGTLWLVEVGRDILFVRGDDPLVPAFQAHS